MRRRRHSRERPQPCTQASPRPPTPPSDCRFLSQHHTAFLPKLSVCFGDVFSLLTLVIFTGPLPGPGTVLGAGTKSVTM